MAKRLSTGFTNEIGDVYVIDIYDDDFGGSSTDCQVDGSGFIQQFTGDYTNYTGGNIITTTTTVNLIADISAVTDFIAVLTSRTENDLRLTITKNGSFWWAGLILPDVVKIDDIPTAARPIFQIRAVDGLARLKTIDYNDDGDPYTGKQTVIEHILNALNKIGTESAWTTNTFITAYSRWLSSDHAAGDNPSVLTRTRVRHLNFIKVDQTGKIGFRSCYDVLKEFCKTFNCNLFLSDGRFWFISPSEYANTLYFFTGRHNFQKDGTATYVVGGANYALLGRKTQTGTTFSVYNLFRYGRGAYEYFPALKQTRVRYKHFSTRNLTAGVSGTGGAFGTVTVEDIDSAGGTARLAFRANLNFQMDFVTPGDAETAHAKFKITIQIGTYYLSRVVTLVDLLYVVEGDMFWTTTPSSYEIIVPMTGDGVAYTNIVEFITPLIPEDGDFVLDFSLFEVVNNANTDLPLTALVPTTSLTGVYSEMLFDGTIEGQYNISEFLATNGTAGNSDEADIETLIGEGPTGSTFGSVDVYNGSNWVQSAGWRYGGSGTYLPLSQLMAQEIMFRHKNPSERLSGDFQGKFNIWQAIQYTVSSVTKMYGFIGGTFVAGESRWTLDLVVLFRSASGVTVPTQENQTEIGSDSDAPPEIQPGGGIAPSNSGVTYTPQGNSGAGIESGIASGFSNGLIPARTNMLIQDGDAVNDLPVAGAPADSSYSAGDEIIVIDPTTGLSQEFTVDDIAFEGDTTIGVVNGTAGQRLNVSSYILHTPEFLLANYGFVRRHYQRFLLFDYTTDLVDTNPCREFWRVGSSSLGFVGRHIQFHQYGIGQPGGNASALYTIIMYKNGVALITISSISGTATGGTSAFDIDGSDPIALNDVYTFSVERTDATAAPNSKGLEFTLIII